MANIAFIGLGNMGGPMAANLVKAGHKVTAFDLVAASRDQAKADGAAIAESAAASVKDADTVITMLPAGKHVLSVWNEVVPAMNKGALIIDCSTIDVESAKQAHALAAKHGIASVDAPVSGGTGGAKGATLTFMCGGEDKAFAAAKPVLENMGKKIVHCGGAGAGQAAKICNNMILGISMIGVGEAFALAEKLGLSHQALFDVASTSSGQCWALTTYCPVPGPVPTSPANNDYKPGFAAALMLKDLTLAQDAANLRGLRRRSASTRRRSTRRSTPPATAGWIFPGLSSTFGVSPGNNGDLMTTFQEARAFLLKHRTDHDAAVKGFPLARSGAVQLGAGLVRRRTGAQCRKPGPYRAVDRRCRQRQGNKALLCRAVAPFQPGREFPARAGAEARRPSAAAARQCRAAVGDHAGGDEARRRRDPRDHAADAR